MPGGMQGDGRHLRTLATRRGRQACASGCAAGRQQSGRTARPRHVQPLHSKCSTISGKALSSCALPCRYEQGRETLWDGAVQWGRGQVWIFTQDMRDATDSLCLRAPEQCLSQPPQPCSRIDETADEAQLLLIWPATANQCHLNWGAHRSHSSCTSSATQTSTEGLSVWI